MQEFGSNELEFLKVWRSRKMMPGKHVEYLHYLRNNCGIFPQVIFDIGANVLHWTDEATEIWPRAEILLFDASEVYRSMYESEKYRFNLEVLSDVENRHVKFYENNSWPGGNSYYRENPEFNPRANEIFPENKFRLARTNTLDSVVSRRNFPNPDFIKIDVQGAELDILKGATNTLKSVRNLIVEIRNVEYNLGAPDKETVIEYIESIGFENKGVFCDNGADADYHFTRS